MFLKVIDKGDRPMLINADRIYCVIQGKGESKIVYDDDTFLAIKEDLIEISKQMQGEQTMRCIDCEHHDYVVCTHFCNYKGKSGRRKPRRISEEDAHKDVPCEYVEELKGADDDI